MLFISTSKFGMHEHQKKDRMTRVRAFRLHCDSFI